MTELRDRWAVVWPPALAAVVVSAVGVPAAVASYRHARAVVEANGDPVMAPWLPLSVDGMLVAALVVIWVRRHRGDPAGWGPWAAFGFGMVVTVAANLAAVSLETTSLGGVLAAALMRAAAAEPAGPTAASYLVALFPPLALSITLELVALVAYRTRRLAQSSTHAVSPHGFIPVDAVTFGVPPEWAGFASADPEPVEEAPTLSTVEIAGHKIMVAQRDGVTFYRRRDIAAALSTRPGRPDSGGGGHHVPASEIVLIPTPILNRVTPTQFVTRRGFSVMAARSRTRHATDVALALGLDIVHLVTPEAGTVRTIVAALPDVTFAEQYNVGPYRVDLFVAEAQLAIECDEHAHAAYDADAERIREAYVRELTGATFVRYNPHATDFNIGDVIADIRAHVTAARAERDASRPLRALPAARRDGGSVTVTATREDAVTVTVDAPADVTDTRDADEDTEVPGESPEDRRKRLARERARRYRQNKTG